MTDVIRQLPRRFILPAWGNFLQIKRRKFTLDAIGKGEVKLRRAAGLKMTEESSGFAGIVIAVVEEVNNLASNFTLETKRGLDFGIKKTLRKKSAGLLAKTDDGSSHVSGQAVLSPRWLRKVCRTMLRITQAAQPISGYQR